MTVTSLRTLFPSVFLPSLIFEVGIGAMLAMVVVRATELGASLATAGLLTALLPVGKILADVPAGIIAARLGDRRAMILASAIAVGAGVLAGFAGRVRRERPRLRYRRAHPRHDRCRVPACAPVLPHRRRPSTPACPGHVDSWWGSPHRAVHWPVRCRSRSPVVGRDRRLLGCSICRRCLRRRRRD